MGSSRTSRRTWCFVLLGVVGLGLLLRLPAEAQPLSHGLWVYGLTERTSTSCHLTTSLLDDDANATQMLGFCGANQITELYLALGPGAVSLRDNRLPNFIAALKGSGRRVEALISCTNTDAPDCASEKWLGHIGDVIDYNNARQPPERFDGIHLDLEPWLHTCPPNARTCGDCDFGWVDPLIVHYSKAATALGNSGLTLAADISGEKIICDTIDAEQRRALLTYATRLVLMEYGGDHPISVDKINQRVVAFQNLALDDLSQYSFMIATRAQDFGNVDAPANACQNGTVLKGFDELYAGTTGYAGWATYKYSDVSDCNQYNDPLICPGDCCAIGP